MNKAPVLLIAFNRPEMTQCTFEAIRASQPDEFYMAVDGPRPNHPEDIEKCNAVQAIVKQVDWKCNVHTLFREENVGCGYGPSNAISWAFETCDRLIILEDDCVASLSFFPFCSEMLERYFDDSRVWMISGRSHHADYPYFHNYDYLFSHSPHTFGWATWKHCWKQFDLRMNDFPMFEKNGGCCNIMLDKEEAQYMNKHFSTIYNRIDEEVKHSWDSQWAYTYMKNGGLGIVSAKNLIQNIGVTGTHSLDGHGKSFDLQADIMDGPYRHPEFVIALFDYDRYHFLHHTKPKSWLVRIWNKLVRVVRYREKLFFKNYNA